MQIVFGLSRICFSPCEYVIYLPISLKVDLLVLLQLYDVAIDNKLTLKNGGWNWPLANRTKHEKVRIVYMLLLTYCGVERTFMVAQPKCSTFQPHYIDVIMTTMASQITSLTVIYSTVYPGADQRKHQSSASLAFVRGIHRGPVNSPHRWPVTRKMFPFDDVIMHYPTQLCHTLLSTWTSTLVFVILSVPTIWHFINLFTFKIVPAKTVIRLCDCVPAQNHTDVDHICLFT